MANHVLDFEPHLALFVPTEDALKYYEALMKLDMTHQERHDKMLEWMEKKNFNMRKPLQYIENEIDRINAKYDSEIAALLSKVEEETRESFTNEEED